MPLEKEVGEKVGDGLRAIETRRLSDGFLTVWVEFNLPIKSDGDVKEFEKLIRILRFYRDVMDEDDRAREALQALEEEK